MEEEAKKKLGKSMTCDWAMCVVRILLFVKVFLLHLFLLNLPDYNLNSVVFFFCLYLTSSFAGNVVFAVGMLFGIIAIKNKKQGLIISTKNKQHLN